jgi:hypothetical protein
VARRRFDRAGGGGSGVRGKEMKEERAELVQSGWVGRMPLGPARREKKREMGRKDDWAEMIFELR